MLGAPSMKRRGPAGGGAVRRTRIFSGLNVPRVPRRYVWIALAAPFLLFFYVISSSSSSSIPSNYRPSFDSVRQRLTPQQAQPVQQLPPLLPPSPPKRQFQDAFVALEGKNLETKKVGGIPGYQMFENLYTHKGILYAVSSNPQSLPSVSEIVSIGEGIADETFYKVITPAQALELFGARVARLEGDTLFFADGPPVSFLDHYYHFVIECFSSAWRVLASKEKGSALNMSPPERVIFPREVKWRDGPGLNAWFLGTVIPTAAIEELAGWNDRAVSGNVYSFERIVIVDRWASHRHNPTANQWNKMNSEIAEVKAPKDWWEPLRQALMYSLHIPDEPLSDKPVITYINRQSTSRRKLKDEDHLALMQALYEVEAEGYAQVYDARMENIGKKEQFALSSRTNILVGVHGNGLSHLMWMKEGSTVVEIFYPEGFTRDYQLMTEPLGHDHYTVWNNTVRRESEWREDGENHFPDDFQGTEIPVSGAFMKELLIDIIKKTKKFSG
ncbi:hypothetical protein BDY24DRAFT_392320 [Mrakia frigida]|uniref:uncharacterized protein n=1 Tax=Mrakia frigida TaxID=29902 RepID=UPI003FCBF634